MEVNIETNIPKVTTFGNQLKILGKLHAILCQLDYIQKDAVNEHAGYNYASEKAIKLALHEAFKTFKILMLTDLYESGTRDISTKEGTAKITVSKAACTFIDIESGESISVTMMGSGNGRDDKGLYASLTGIIKYALTSTFLIPTGDDAESDEKGRPTFIPMEKPPQAEPTKKEEAPPSLDPQTKKDAAAPRGKKPAPKAPDQAQPPKQEQALAPAPTRRTDLGIPKEGEPTISAAAVGKILEVFAKYKITRAELEAKAGFPMDKWTESMKSNLLTDYQALKTGRCNKQQFLESECVAIDFPPKGGAQANV